MNRIIGTVHATGLLVEKDRELRFVAAGFSNMVRIIETDCKKLRWVENRGFKFNLGKWKRRGILCGLSRPLQRRRPSGQQCHQIPRQLGCLGANIGDLLAEYDADAS